jgi:hypothetical protein
LFKRIYFLFSRTSKRAARHYIKERTNKRKPLEQSQTHPKAHTAQRKRSIKEKEKKYSRENIVKGWKPYLVATNKTGKKINSSSKNKNTKSTEDVDSCNIVQMSTLRGEKNSLKLADA